MGERCWVCVGLLGAAGSPRVCAGDRPVVGRDVASATGVPPFPEGLQGLLSLWVRRGGGKALQLIWKSPDGSSGAPADGRNQG